MRGTTLHRAIWAESCIAIMIFTYNQASTPNLVTLPSFYNQFPQINTVTTTGTDQAHKAVIQGEPQPLRCPRECAEIVDRHRHLHLRLGGRIRRLILHVSGRQIGTALDHMAVLFGASDRLRPTSVCFPVRSTHRFETHSRLGHWRHHCHSICVASRDRKSKQSRRACLELRYLLFPGFDPVFVA